MKRKLLDHLVGAASTFVRQERVFSEAGATLVLEAVVLTLGGDDGRMVQ